MGGNMRPSHVARTLLMVSWLLVTSALSAAEVKEVAYRSGDETVHGLVFVPSGKGPFPGLLAIHAVFGLDEWTKEQASKLADAGYVVLALDFYRGKVARTLDDGVKLSRAVPMRAARSSGGTSAVMDATMAFCAAVQASSPRLIFQLRFRRSRRGSTPAARSSDSTGQPSRN